MALWNHGAMLEGWERWERNCRPVGLTLFSRCHFRVCLPTSRCFLYILHQAMPQCFKCGTTANVGEVAVWDNQQWIWVRDAIDQWDPAWKRWEQRPEAIWNLPSSTVEACDIFCARCWKDWGRHIKPGSKYALSKACEELAVRVGVEFVDSNSGNPFYCRPCKVFHNHGASSLEKHLLERHSDQVCAALKARLLHKRKADAVTEDFIPRTLHVSCSRSLIAGKYTVKSWHHGKPVYQKADQDGSDINVLIYYWDNRDGERFHGWWFSPREGSREAWAHNSSNLGRDDLTVPTSGWICPRDGEVDQTLKITTHEQNEDTDGQKDTDFELRWEFLASADGEKDDWQPASKNINDALERRWKQGWHGDNGTDIFQIQSNGYTYNIDCRCMVQWNVKTNRRREIRRGEAKPDVMVLLPKLAEKDAEVERLQNKRNRLVEEKNDLMAKIAQLEWLGATNWQRFEEVVACNFLCCSLPCLASISRAVSCTALYTEYHSHSPHLAHIMIIASSSASYHLHHRRPHPRPHPAPCSVHHAPSTLHPAPNILVTITTVVIIVIIVIMIIIITIIMIITRLVLIIASLFCRVSST